MACTQLIREVIDEKAVIRTDDKVVVVVKCTGLDANRGKLAHCRNSVLSDPLYFLRPVIAG